MRGTTPASSGFPVRWSGGFAVAGMPADPEALTAPAIAGELCAALDSGMPGLIIDLSGTGWCDSVSLEALMRAARRARGWGSWLRLAIPDAGARKMVRLVALDEVMPVHTSVPDAIAAAGRETPITWPVTNRRGGHQPQPVLGCQGKAAAWGR